MSRRGAAAPVMIILTGAVTIIMSPMTTADFTTTITQAIMDITTVIVEVEADVLLATSTENTRVILPMLIRVVVIRMGYQNEGQQNGQNAFQTRQ